MLGQMNLGPLGYFITLRHIYSSKQPCDHGLLDDVAVLHVTRHGAGAVHFVESALPVGKVVKQKLDWERRLDHMQQHSGKVHVLIML
jgi:Ser-tRNA(Ala) deacylase AlaX